MLRHPRFVLTLCSLLMVACGEREDTAESSLMMVARHRGDRNITLTPGDLCSRQNPHFDGYRYAEHIPHCRRAVSHETKTAVAAAYGIYGEERYDYEIDHFIPLNIGGSNDPRNLWPLYVPLAREKSRYEQWLMNQVAEGQIVQAAAIERIRAWKPGLDYEAKSH